MRSDWADLPTMAHVLAAMMPINRLIIQVSMATGLRVGDVLALRADKLAERMTVREAKTGKTRRVYIPKQLLARMYRARGAVWVFEGRNDPLKHRTRQAVYNDVQRAVAAFKRVGTVPKELHISPHTARKMAAVAELDRTGDLDAVARLLNHGRDSSVTALYAYADMATAARINKAVRRAKK